MFESRTASSIFLTFLFFRAILAFEERIAAMKSVRDEYYLGGVSRYELGWCELIMATNVMCFQKIVISTECHGSQRKRGRHVQISIEVKLPLQIFAHSVRFALARGCTYRPHSIAW